MRQLNRKIKKDEREIEHEALAERNASWFMVITLGAGIIYQTVLSITQGHLAIDPFIIVWNQMMINFNCTWGIGNIFCCSVTVM